MPDLTPTALRAAIRARLTDQALIDAIAVGEPEYRGAGLWLMRAVDAEKMRDTLLDALSPALDGAGWQPMDSAPKDGTNVWGIDADGVQFTMCWYDYDYRHLPHPVRPANKFTGWLEMFHGVGIVEPTHWQPLPPSPEEDR